MKKIFILILSLFLASGLFAEEITNLTPVPFGTPLNEIFNYLSEYKINSNKGKTIDFSALNPAELFSKRDLTITLNDQNEVMFISHTMLFSEAYSSSEYLDKFVNHAINNYELTLTKFEKTIFGPRLTFTDPYDHFSQLLINYDISTICLYIGN